MLRDRIVPGVVALSLFLPGAAMAQSPYQHQTQIQIQYHERVASHADSAPVFLRIFGRIRKDCALVGKAFHKRCTIRQINIYTNSNYGGDLAGSRTINATANLVLIEEATDGPHALAGPAPSSAARLSTTPSK